VAPKIFHAPHRSAIAPVLNRRRQPRHAGEYSIGSAQVDLPDMKRPADPYRPTHRLHQVTGLHRCKVAGIYLDSHAGLARLDAHQATIRTQGLGEHHAAPAMQNSERLDMAGIHRHCRPGKVRANFAQLDAEQTGQGLRMLGCEFFQRYFPLPNFYSQFEPLLRNHLGTGGSMPTASPLSMQPG
jgi:hypothetical protein